MTRKSSARINRDKHQQRIDEARKKMQTNSCWDDLNGIHASCTGLLASHSATATVLRNKELMAFVTDVPALIDASRSLARDLGTMHEELKKLGELHAGKTGGTDDPDELIYSIQIHEQYALFMERHEGVVMPTAATILDLIGEAERRQTVAAHALLEGEGLLEEGKEQAFEPSDVSENGDGTVTIDTEAVSNV